MGMRTKLGGMLVIVALLGAGCGDDDDNSLVDAGTGARDGAAGGDGAVSQLSNGQAADVVQTINTGEINEAQLALTKASDASVKQFANQMITDHTTSMAHFVTILEQQHLTRANNPISDQLKMQTATELNMLGMLSGSAFDVAYMTGQVKDHDDALRVIDAQVLPNVTNEALRTEIVAFRATVNTHLERARVIVQQLTTSQTAAPTP